MASRTSTVGEGSVGVVNVGVLVGSLIVGLAVVGDSVVSDALVRGANRVRNLVALVDLREFEAVALRDGRC